MLVPGPGKSNTRYLPKKNESICSSDGKRIDDPEIQGAQGGRV